MSNYCFVIQPFDGGKFDKRYDDVFAPAINSILGLEAYRVDKDFGVDVPIEAIEEKIENSKICLADITLDNPNVWYEVGFARAKGKPLVLLCSDERKTQYPFDIRHRTVLSYKTESTQDYDELSANITTRIQAVLTNPVSIPVPANLVEDIEGLTYYEIALLGAVLKKQDVPGEGCSSYHIKEEMRNNGLNEIAFNIAFAQLSKKEFISSEKRQEHDYNGNYLGDYMSCSISNIGFDWVMSNVGKFDLKFVPQQQSEQSNSDELPF